eukprot:scaffold151393_cov31-Prasinocladus_malaysianus.AAC.1
MVWLCMFIAHLHSQAVVNVRIRATNSDYFSGHLIHNAVHSRTEDDVNYCVLLFIYESSLNLAFSTTACPNLYHNNNVPYTCHYLSAPATGWTFGCR